MGCLQERYLSVTLGIKSISDVTFFLFNEESPGLSVENVYHRQLCHIAGLILDRNRAGKAYSLSVMYEIQEKLDLVSKKVPVSWWSIPSSFVATRTRESAIQFERAMCQIWHYDLQVLLHLPSVLCATYDHKYMSSQKICLEACRTLLERWILIRGQESPTLFSNLVDFQALTSVVTLLLAQIGFNYAIKYGQSINFHEESANDLVLIERVMNILQSTGSTGHEGEEFTGEFFSTVQTLQRILLESGTPSQNLLLKIPHYGTIGITQTRVIPPEVPSRNSVINASSSGPEGSPNRKQTPIADHSKMNAHTAWLPQSDAFPRSGGGQSSSDQAMNPPAIHFQSSHFSALDSEMIDINSLDHLFENHEVLLLDSMLRSDVDWTLDWTC